MRNLKRELGYFQYRDMEDGGEEEKIDYDCLIGLLQEILHRLDELDRVTASLSRNPPSLNRLEE